MLDYYFTVEYHGSPFPRTYTVLGDKNTTLDTVWASQKCWFTSGSTVKISDEYGNSKIFTA